MTKHFFKKSLGQNFITNQNIIERIVSNVKIENKMILEIGPGNGALTGAIIAKKPLKLICVEKDNTLIDTLKNKFNEKNISIINQDALKFDINSILNNNEKLTIISNLPYNIGTTLLLNWMNSLSQIESITVMLQKEVVERIVAKPKTKDYGRLSVLIQSLCEAKKLFNVSAGNFFPKPNVESAIVQITPKSSYINSHLYEKLKNFSTIIFANKRKTIHKVVKNHLNLHPEDLNLVAIEELITTNTRAEELKVDDILKIITH